MITGSRPFHQCQQRGLAVVEFTIVLPVLLMLLLACGELGRALLQYNTLTKSVRLAGRYLAETARNDAGVIDLSAADQAIAENLAVFGAPLAGNAPLLPGLNSGNISITTVDADHVAISAAYSYQPLFLAIPTFGLTADAIDTPGALNASYTVMAL